MLHIRVASWIVWGTEALTYAEPPPKQDNTGSEQTDVSYL